MKLLIDENVDRLIVDRLRADGHEIWSINELQPGITDEEVLQKAVELSALLVTADKDFGELIFQKSSNPFFGVVLVRLSGLSAQRKAEIVSEAFRQHGLDFTRSFSVVAPGRIRSQTRL